MRVVLCAFGYLDADQLILTDLAIRAGAGYPDFCGMHPDI